MELLLLRNEPKRPRMPPWLLLNGHRQQRPMHNQQQRLLMRKQMRQPRLQQRVTRPSGGTMIAIIHIAIKADC